LSSIAAPATEEAALREGRVDRPRTAATRRRAANTGVWIIDLDLSSLFFPRLKYGEVVRPVLSRVEARRVCEPEHSRAFARDVLRGAEFLL